jgi:hypothetical protein
MEKKRRVKYFQYGRHPLATENKQINSKCKIGNRPCRFDYRQKSQGLGTFIAFGVDSEELDHGSLTYSTAIIEKDNGEVVNIPVENMQFIKESNKCKCCGDLVSYALIDCGVLKMRCLPCSTVPF